MWIFNYDWGAANALLRALGLGAWATAWLGHPDTALPALILVTTWMWTGFNMVVLLAAMHSLPKPGAAGVLKGLYRSTVLRHRSALTRP